MKPFRWNDEKNEWLKRERGISFERLVAAIEAGSVVDIVPNPNRARYPGQSIFVVVCGDYAYLVPFVEDEDHVFLKTAFANRKATRDYLGRDI